MGRAVLSGSTPPTSDSLWSVARARGFEVIVHERNMRNREKKVDTQIAVEMTQDSFERMKPQDTVTLVSGDTDHVPAVQ
ncbi:MAG: NYN domain-containing protein [Planctomycetota bacterium]